MAFDTDKLLELKEEKTVLTIEIDGEYETEGEQSDRVWHEVQNAYRSRRILSGILGGVEETESGSIVVVYYKDFRVIIPVGEMMLNLTSQDGYGEMKLRELRILNNMLGCEIDFIIMGLDSEARSIVASRKQAMIAKRKKFFFPNESGASQITEGRVVQARIIAVAEKVVRIEVFGVECAIPARNLSWEWVGDAREKFRVGDRTLALITSIELDKDTGDVKIMADMKMVTKNEVLQKLNRCKIQGRYSGRVTDIHKGVMFVKLNIGVNAIAHTCTDRRMPGKHDDVSFVVNRIDQENGVAVGIITRIIRQNI